MTALSSGDRDRARIYAEKVAGEGHHRNCATHRRGPDRYECDCFFGKGEFLLARALLESEREADEWEENADRILGEIGGTLPG